MLLIYIFQNITKAHEILNKYTCIKDGSRSNTVYTIIYCFWNKEKKSQKLYLMSYHPTFAIYFYLIIKGLVQDSKYILCANQK